MRTHRRSDDYLTGDAEPLTIKRTPGSTAQGDLKKLTAWLAKRGEPSGWRRRKKGKS